MLWLLSILLLIGCAHNSGIHEAETAWKFAVVSDTQGNNQNNAGKSCINDLVVQAIAGDIAKEHPDFVLVTGDLVNGWFKNGGTDYAVQYANWKAALASVYGAGIQSLPGQGQS